MDGAAPSPIYRPASFGMHMDSDPPEALVMLGIYSIRTGINHVHGMMRSGGAELSSEVHLICITSHLFHPLSQILVKREPNNGLKGLLKIWLEAHKEMTDLN